MRRLFSLVAFWLAALAIQGDTVPVSLASFSVQIQPATVRNFGLITTLSISSTEQPTNPNGELQLADETVPFSHDGFFILDDPTFPEPVPLFFGLNVPDEGDANTNGLSDFFDVAIETPGLKTSGTYDSPLGGAENFTATWTRAAGQSSGKVVIDLPSLGKFTHDYWILQFEGMMTYSRTNKSIAGSVTLTNIVAAEDQISGPLSITITNNTKLGYDSGTWTGSAGASYVFHSIDSLDRFGTNYVAALAIDEGYPATSAEDYHYWFLLIHSTDANKNGVLDLVESATPIEPERPRLEIRKVQAGVEISIFATTGNIYSLEAANSLDATSWATLQTVSVNSSPQTVQIEAAGPMKFFRLRKN